MLRDRQELHMGEAHLGDVGGELDGQLPVVQALAPGAEVHLVDRHGRAERIAGPATTQPAIVLPLVSAGEDHRAGRGGHLGGEGEGVGLLAPDAVLAEDGELVDGAIADGRDEELPHSRRPQRSHRMSLAVPVVEGAGDADALGGRRPYGEGDAGDVAVRAGIGAHVRSQHPPHLLVPTLADEVEVELAQAG